MWDITKRIFVATSWLQCLMTASFSFADISQAEQAIEDKDYIKAYQLLVSYPNQDEPKLQYYLGSLTYEGLGVEKNAQKGLEMLAKSGRQKFNPAMVRLAATYAVHVRSGKDSAELFYWVTQLAHTDDPYWERELAALYRLGIGTDVDFEASFNWIMQSAMKNYGPAEFDLYSYYKKGTGVEADANMARWWLKKAYDKQIEGTSDLWEKEMAAKSKEKAAHYQTLVTNDSSTPQLLVYFSLACPHCLDFFNEDFEYYLEQASEGKITIILREVPFRLSGNQPDSYGSLEPNVRKPSYYLHCIRSNKANFAAASALVKLTRLAKQNIAPVKEGSTSYDWRMLAYTPAGSMKGFRNKDELYRHWLATYKLEPDQCNEEHYTAYVENLENRFKGKSADEYAFNGKKFSNGITELHSDTAKRKRLRAAVESYVSRKSE